MLFLAIRNHILGYICSKPYLNRYL